VIAAGWEAYLSTLPLRERKKARTKLAIQEQALRMFGERGYESTTIDDIAEAAEVAPRTVFRYFATKDELVLWDVMDESHVVGLALQVAPGEAAVPAVMRNLGEILTALGDGGRASILRRLRLVLGDPGLLATAGARLMGEVESIAAIIAAASDLPPDDPETRVLVAACLGAWWQAGLEWARSGGEIDLGARRSDRVFAHDILSDVLHDGFAPPTGDGAGPATDRGPTPA
jgi:AcrR family transcriptional regulator